MITIVLLIIIVTIIIVVIVNQQLFKIIITSQKGTRVQQPADGPPAVGQPATRDAQPAIRRWSLQKQGVEPN